MTISFESEKARNQWKRLEKQFAGKKTQMWQQKLFFEAQKSDERKINAIISREIENRNETTREKNGLAKGNPKSYYISNECGIWQIQLFMSNRISYAGEFVTIIETNTNKCSLKQRASMNWTSHQETTMTIKWSGVVIFSLCFSTNGKDFNVQLTPIILDLKRKTILCTVYVFM